MNIEPFQYYLPFSEIHCDCGCLFKMKVKVEIYTRLLKITTLDLSRTVVCPCLKEKP